MGKRVIKGTVNRRKIASSGMPLSNGMGVYDAFSVVTDSKLVISKNVEISFTSTQGTSNDYVASYKHVSQFSTTTGGVITNDGSTFNNNIIARSAQMIAPVDCSLKDVVGYVNTASGTTCSQTFIISIWKKAVTDGGTTATKCYLLFNQSFVLASTANSYSELIDISLDESGGLNNTVDRGEGIFVSIRRSVGTACGNFQANFEMVFESSTADTNVTSNELMLPALSRTRGGRIGDVLSE